MLVFPILAKLVSGVTNLESYEKGFVETKVMMHLINNTWDSMLFVHTTMPINSSVIIFSFAVIQKTGNVKKFGLFIISKSSKAWFYFQSMEFQCPTILCISKGSIYVEK